MLLDKASLTANCPSTQERFIQSVDMQPLTLLVLVLKYYITDRYCLFTCHGPILCSFMFSC